jgi:hypothetical protein
LARASGIWIVRQAYPDADLMRGAFTVKHECAKWLKGRPDPTAFLIERYQDGNPSAGCVRIPVHELLQMTTY